MDVCQATHLLYRSSLDAVFYDAFTCDAVAPLDFAAPGETCSMTLSTNAVSRWRRCSKANSIDAKHEALSFAGRNRTRTAIACRATESVDENAVVVDSTLAVVVGHRHWCANSASGREERKKQEDQK